MTIALDRAILSLLSPAGRHGRLIILTFHRVLERPDPLLATEPDAHQFQAILEWVAELCHVLPLAEAVERLRCGRLPQRAAAITFDDGYRNNLEVAKPLLTKLGLPATVFVAAEPLRRGVMWNDEIIEAVRHAEGTLDLQDLGFGSIEIPDDDRWFIVERLIADLKYRAAGEREELANELHRRAVGRPAPRQMLTESEVPMLAGDGIDIGAHTMTHPILVQLSDDRARWEIEQSRRWLHDLVGVPPGLFAYPNGQRDYDYDQRHVRMVEEAGFSAAVTTRWAAARQRSPDYELPRFTPWERDLHSFARRLVKTCAASYAPSR